MSGLNLNQAWLTQLKPQFDTDYMQALFGFLKQQQEKGKVIYPASADFFAAFNATPLDKVKVVILGQDPYHGEGYVEGQEKAQAHGLSFSVPQGLKPPPSLKNIYKELIVDIGISPPDHGNLTAWAEQGVLLLNSVLTVEQGKAGSHRGQGWEKFTDEVIQLLNALEQNVVFMLWGAYAQKKGAKINRQHHLVLESAHPSPLSAYRGFLGCKHFSQANAYLQQHGQQPINWQP